LCHTRGIGILNAAADMSDSSIGPAIILRIMRAHSVRLASGRKLAIDEVIGDWLAAQIPHTLRLVQPIIVPAEWQDQMSR
jgi:hypothetical protein